VPVLLENLQSYTALLVGPGLGNTTESHAFVAALLRPASRRRSAGFIREDIEPQGDYTLPPLVVDADGLNILSEMPDWPALLPPETILTPHPGEMARLTGLTTAEIQRNRLEIAQTWVGTWKQILVLKGAFTIVAAPGRSPVILPFANPGLSSAGTGDVLAGTIVALRAQGVAAFEAAVAGAFLHGLAGELVAEQHGAAGTAAGDVALALAEAGRRLYHK
jgi:ADP-dependent NAD(P)H-hydrate dehydratase / NAD(P)H-hydrate epimerase